MHHQIHKDLVKAQYASQKLIQMLSEQNLMTFDTITMVNNKLNSFIEETDDEINNIYSVLKSFSNKRAKNHGFRRPPYKR